MEFLTGKELKGVLKSSEAAIHKWRQQGMPTRRFGKLVRFELDAVLRWFEQHETRKRGGEVGGGTGKPEAAEQAA